jgi:hypothetical protein
MAKKPAMPVKTFGQGGNITVAGGKVKKPVKR